VKGIAAILERGRAAYGRREWVDAFAAFEEADRQSPLEVADLERFSWSASLAARDEEFVKCLERLVQLHIDAGRCERAAIVAFWLGFRLISVGEGARGSGWLARAERLAERAGTDSVVRGYLLLPQCRRHQMAGDDEAARDVAARASQIGEQYGDVDLATFARAMEGRVLLAAGKVERGLSLLDECLLSAARPEVLPMVTGLVYCIAIASCQRVYAIDRAREWTRVLEGWCASQPQMVQFSTSCLVHRAEIMQLSGAWPEAIKEAERAALCCPPTMAPQDGADALYQQAEIRRLRGELVEAEELYRAASLRGREPQPGLSLLRAAQGQHEAAATTIRRVLGSITAPLDRARHLPAFVEITLGAGALEEARRGCEELAALASRFDTEVLRGMADHARGSVALAEGDPRSALAPLRSAFRIWQQVAAPYIAARIRVELGAACRALGDEDGARLEFEAAREVFEKLGAAADCAMASRALEAGPGGATLVRGKTAQGKVKSHAPSHGLTARELEVLRLVAQGKTNKTIAKELFLSEKTVDRHVSNIFAKVNVATRAAATAFAYEHDLI
jgi:DNA-binding CsgD family transcriptional regulator